VSSFPSLEHPLGDGVISLRASAERDIPEVLIAFQDDRELHHTLGEDRPPTGAQLGRRAEQAEREWARGSSVILTITEAGDDTCLGEVRIYEVDWVNRHATVAVWVAPRRRGAGLAQRALSLSSRWLLRDCGLERVGITTDARNVKMIRAARAAGFTEEGVLRGYTRDGGTRADGAVLSRVRGDLAG
jgi:RimJ/RimL family protein N-acetyltransferase